MALNKQNLAIPFATGVDQKTDPLQENPNELSVLVNGVYNKDRRVDKRNGFAPLTVLPDNTNPTTLTTFRGNLTVVGSSLQSYVAATQTWVDKGKFQPVQLSTVSAQKNSNSQTSVDSAYSDTGLVCITFLDSDGAWKYQINDSTNGQVLVAPTEPESGAYGTRAAILGPHFIVSYVVVVAATPRLKFVAVPLASVASPLAAQEISNLVLSATSAHDVCYDPSGDLLYYAWEGPDAGNSVRITSMDVALNVFPAAIAGTTAADLVSISYDTTNNTLWMACYDGGATTTRVAAFNPATLATVLALTTYEATDTVVNLAAQGQDGFIRVFRQIENTYSFSSTRTDYLDYGSVAEAGTVTAPSVLVRHMGLASKAFIVNSQLYVLGATSSAYQSSYYLLDNEGDFLARLAYSNGDGYAENGLLASVDVDGTISRCAYLVKDTLLSVNKSIAPDSVGGVFTQTGVNLVSFNLAQQNLSTAEIGANLHIAGGFLWAFDGTNLTEQGFNYWCEDFETSVAGTAGNMAQQQYYYVVVYEWTDAQGNIHRSAPSLPVGIELTGGDDEVDLDIPTLRLTYKSDVRVVIYRWSAGQQNFYQVTSITSPLLNDPTVDSVSYNDQAADSSIIGNPLLYTTGGVVENIPGPACSSISLYRSRLVLINSENKNQIWYSKLLFESTPVEMSDLFTLFVSPTIGAQGSTGDTEVIFPMDEKLLFFKQDAIYYLIGQGPDDTGANNDFGEPSFITSAVGSDNQDSMLTIPQGVLFQSDKGIWLLSRELSTVYLGSAVEDFALENTVTSAQIVPGTTQARFTLSNSTAVVFDYFFQRWTSFDQVPAISSTLYQRAHTYLTSTGEVRQEQTGYFKDGSSSPTLLKFETPWLNLAGLQGYQRVYEILMVGRYKSPHTLVAKISYDFEESPSQQILLIPEQTADYYGGNSYYGGGQAFGGLGSLEQYRIFPNRQKVQSFKLKVEEQFDASQGTQAGEGLTLSGLDLVVGIKKGYTPIRASRSFG